MVIWMLASRLLILIDSGFGPANNHGTESATSQPSTNEFTTAGSRSETSRSATGLDHSSNLFGVQLKDCPAGYKEESSYCHPRQK